MDMKVSLEKDESNFHDEKDKESPLLEPYWKTNVKLMNSGILVTVMR